RATSTTVALIHASVIHSRRIARRSTARCSAPRASWPEPVASPPPSPPLVPPAPLGPPGPLLASALSASAVPCTAFTAHRRARRGSVRGPPAGRSPPVP